METKQFNGYQIAKHGPGSRYVLIEPDGTKHRPAGPASRDSLLMGFETGRGCDGYAHYCMGSRLIQEHGK